MSEKNANFHRLAQKRVETLLDQIRVFSNLSGPSYDWNQDEVWAYFGQITGALEEALKRFQEQKRWHAGGMSVKAAPEPTEPQESQEEAIDGELPSPIPLSPIEEANPGADRERRRKRSVAELIQAAEGDDQMLPEMLVLQREVIDNLQCSLDEARSRQPLA